MGVLKKLGWDKDLTAGGAGHHRAHRRQQCRRGVAGRSTSRAASSASASSTASCHYGNGKARANAWNLPDPVPVHREPIYTPRPDLVAKYPTRPDERQFRMPNIGFSVQKAAVDEEHRQGLPDHPDLGPPRRIRGRRRGDALQPVARRAAAGHVRRDQHRPTPPTAASRTGSGSGCSAPRTARKTKVKALVTDRVGKGVAFMPFHFAGWYQGDDMRDRTIRRAPTRSCSARASTRSRPTASTRSRACRRPKATLCQIRAA